MGGVFFRFSWEHIRGSPLNGEGRLRNSRTVIPGSCWGSNFSGGGLTGAVALRVKPVMLPPMGCLFMGFLLLGAEAPSAV